MFTDCPSCERLFRIRAAQLKAADGWVRCGYCAETFYALARLYDAPVKEPPAQPQPEEAAQKPPTADVDVEQAETLPVSIGQPDVVPVEQEDEAEAVAALTQPDQTRSEDIDQEQAVVTEESELPSDLPPILENEAEETTRSSSRYIWAGLIILLLLMALMQGAWFNRDRLLQEYPRLTPWVEKLCERLQCDLIRFRDLSAIKLLHREVRLHPRYRDALQVSATIVNQAESVQPYPDIELAVFATNGRLISHGRFSPAEYLNAGMNHAAGMPPEVPVHFVLELAGAAQESESFQFRFH